MKTNNLVNFLDKLPSEQKRDELVEAAASQFKKLDLLPRREELLQHMKLRRAKPYLHAVETEKNQEIAYEEVIDDIGPLSPTLGTLYLHIPFCTKRCTWCHYYKEINVADHIINEYPSLMTKELSIVLRKFGLEKVFPISTHFGGGTPSLLSINQWQDLLNRLKPMLEIKDGNEVAIECDPENITSEKAVFWRNQGINRISLGIQSFDKEIIALLKRKHNLEIAEQSYFKAVEAGFENINIDLMYGMPGRTLASWLSDIRQIMKLRPESVTIYATRPDPADTLEHFSKFPTDEERIFSHLLAFNALHSIGYQQYSPNQFIRSYKGACVAKRERNQCHSVLGVGPQAHSIIKNWFYLNNTTLRNYRDLLRRGQLSPLKGARMSPLEQRIRFIEFGLKLSGLNKPIWDNGVLLKEYQQNFSEKLEERFADKISFLNQEGLVVIDENSLHLAEPGIYLNRDVVRYFAMAV